MKVFILFRIYVLEESRKETVKAQVKRAFKSLKTCVQKTNSKADVVLLINDDSPREIDNRRWLKDECKALEKSSITVKTYRTEGVGSALALYNLKREFISQTEELPGTKDEKIAKGKAATKDKDIAIILDQDDELTGKAIQSIIDTFKTQNADLVISDFKQEDPNKLGIVIKGGKIHTEFLKQKRDIPYADSIGWSKSYSRDILKRHLDDLSESMAKEDDLTSTMVGEKDSKLIEFYKAHTAYDDFMDFGALLYKDIKIGRNRSVTHIYHKNSGSITGTPKLNDFMVTRARNLLGLVNLVYHISPEELCPNAYKLLYNYMAVKMTAIENILNDYRDKFYKGCSCYGEIAAKTHPNYFIRKLTRMAMEQNSDKDSATESKTRANFCRLLENSDVIQEHFDMNLNSVRYLCQMACYQERERMKMDKKRKWPFCWWEKKDKNTFHEFVHSSRSLNRKRWVLITWITLLIAIMAALIFLPTIKSWLEPKHTILIESDHALTIATIIMGLASLCLNKLFEVNGQKEAEENLRQMYCEEFKDLIRHIEAGCKVLLEIRKELDKKSSYRPSPIHFVNLCIPHSSHLLTNEIIGITPKEHIEQIARIKVNVRNINNSGMYLKNYAASPSYNAKTMKELIEWELARYFGYLVNFKFVLNSEKFKFPTHEEQDIYLEKAMIRHELTELVLGENADKRIVTVNKYIDKYQKDRRETRAIIMEE